MDRHVAALLACALLLPAIACNRPAEAPAGGQVGGGLGAGAGSPTAAATAASFPSGAIVAFSGQVPPGWTVCDGRMTPTGRPTPDLRGRFLMGADPNTGEAGQSGGNASHTHTATAAAGKGARGSDSDNDFYAASSSHTHDVQVQPAESLPPYVKLVYAMKD